MKCAVVRRLGTRLGWSPSGRQIWSHSLIAINGPDSSGFVRGRQVIANPGKTSAIQARASDVSRGLLRTFRAALLAGAASLLAPRMAYAQTDRATQQKQIAETVDTAKFKKAGPYTIGVAAGYMSNSWVVFCLQHIRWEASLHKDVKDVIVTDAAFNPGKQVADIEDLIAKNVSLIIYWPVDEKAIQPALEKAVATNKLSTHTFRFFI